MAESLDTKRKAYRADFVKNPRLANTHLLDWLKQREESKRDSADEAVTAEETFGFNREAKAFKEVLKHIDTMSK